MNRKEKVWIMCNRNYNHGITKKMAKWERKEQKLPDSCLQTALRDLKTYKYWRFQPADESQNAG